MRELPLDAPDAGRLVLRIKIGDRVAAGDIIADVETEKASQELEAFESFTLRGIRKTADGFILTIED